MGDTQKNQNEKYYGKIKLSVQSLLIHMQNIEELTIENLNQSSKFDFGFFLVSNEL